MSYKTQTAEQHLKAKAARLRHYYANKEPYIERAKARRAEMRGKLAEIKDVPCMDCGIKYPIYIMDLDHRNPSEKSGNIGDIINNGGWEKFYIEVAKCDVICSNCHRERTWGSSLSEEQQIPTL